MTPTPFRQHIHFGDVGSDVLAVKLCLRRLQVRGAENMSTSRKAGKAFVGTLVNYQRSMKLKPDGDYGPVTHARLAAHFSAWERWLYKAARIRKPTPSLVRQKILAYCKWAEAHEPQIHYAEIRPIPWNPRKLPMTTDCSGYATIAYKDAGALDPNGFGYNGAGNTTSLLARGRVITRPQLQVGDLVFYEGPEHVAIYKGNGRVSSHGSEGDPRDESIDYRTVYHLRSYL